MSKRGGRISVDLVRKGLLLALLAFVAAVVGLYVWGRMGRPGEPPRSDELEEEKRGELVLSGKGFEYGLTKGDREVFRIKAERILSDKQNNYELEGVDLNMEHEDGSMYYLSSDAALYNLDKQQATFTGNVKFRGPNRVELTTDGLELREEGRLLVSSSPVEFLFLDRFQGRADRMRINPGKNLLVLAGRVEVDTLPGDSSPMTLRCRRFGFERDEHLMRADGNAILTRGGDVLSSRRLSVILTEDERQVEVVLARWQVEGKFLQESDDGQTSTVRLFGHELSVHFEIGTEDPEIADLKGSERQTAALGVTDQSGVTRLIRANHLIGSFESGALRRAQAFEEVEISEHLAFSPETRFRTACADEADAKISRLGELSQVDLFGTVMLNDQDVAAFGDEAHADMVSQKMELIGKPSLLLRDQDQLEAPRILYDQGSEEISAEDGVRAVLGGGQDLNLGTEEAASDQPITIEGNRVEWADQPPTVTFFGQVRAWQGENFLTTDELRGEPESSRVIATGRVRTVWRPNPEAERSSASESLPQDPLEVTADSMEFDRDNNLLTYTGSARAVQVKRSLRCEEIRLYLREGSGFERMVCEGSVFIQDGETGDTVTGDTATYRPDAEEVEVEGSPVVMRDKDGLHLEGKTVVYDFVTGTARLKSAPIEPPRSEIGQR